MSIFPYFHVCILHQVISSVKNTTKRREGDQNVKKLSSTKIQTVIPVFVSSVEEREGKER
jgi:hypothetical protein